MNQQIRVENKKVYLDRWLIGSIGRTFTGRYFFAADENYCSPLEAKDLRDIADTLDRMNKVTDEP
ncbi:MAG TPA: hypothetical protein PLP17_12065 [Oligoflexia bacterium]|nr:hypothetical protein [Oligoflexia bacterium]